MSPCKISVQCPEKQKSYKTFRALIHFILRGKKRIKEWITLKPKSY